MHDGFEDLCSGIARPQKKKRQRKYVELEVTYPVRRSFFRRPGCISSPESCSAFFRLSVLPGIMFLCCVFKSQTLEAYNNRIC